MTTTVEQEQQIEKGLLKVKSVHGVAVYVDPQTGEFSAKFSQGAGLKWFERPTLTQLELLIAQHVLDFNGQVEAGTAPTAPFRMYEIDQLAQALDPDSSARAYNRIYQRRPTTTFTGVQRVERHRGGTTVVFRLQDGSTTSVETEYVKPDPALDADFYLLAQQYLENLREWKDRFDAVIARYEPITAQQVVDELRAQGARVGRA